MEKRKQLERLTQDNDATFPGYPGLKRQAHTDRGLATLLSVSQTSDGFLLGFATFENKDGEVYDTHSVFLGSAADYR